MKLETIKTQTTEVFLEGKDFTVTATNWSNHEGANVICNGKDLGIRTAFSMTWEEIDLIITALSAART